MELQFSLATFAGTDPKADYDGLAPGSVTGRHLVPYHMRLQSIIEGTFSEASLETEIIEKAKEENSNRRGQTI